ncbi:winged helix-turn-helix domain-containing protein [Aeromicrobium massiliense]|uniref:winged helix-turn-helix domain-containing protein n=1 Tax=Aeromicrobium massiliense TaxID=1464554 RepID=UPI0005782F52|nr:crosslink repair DNA glycosylase YcaQ family protein [Aeromicrobium massiliense]
MTEPLRLSVLQARRIALAAQGFTRPRPEQVQARHLGRVVDRLGFFQIDSVNVLTRAHYVPLYSRLGPYDTELLHRASSRAPRRLVEYWAHEAALLDVRLWPAFGFRRRDLSGMWGGPRRIAEERPELLDRVLQDVRERGPITARQVEHEPPADRDHWGWNWSEAKQALEHLFYTGAVMAAGRNGSFERLYDVPERVLPPAVRGVPDLDADEAHRLLVSHAARALGVATAGCLRDYFRLAAAPTKAAVEQLVAAGELEPVQIAGWNRPAYLHADAVRPRKVEARALLSPFDPLVFERTRTEKLFGFRYRIEIYVPEAQRVHGYYVLPFLLGDRLVARVDLKADRAEGVLRVRSAFAEDHAPDHTADSLAAELVQMAGWLGLGRTSVERRGDLADPLAAALACLD